MNPQLEPTLTLLLEKSERILSKDSDKYYINNLHWLTTNFSKNPQLLKMYVDDLVENCLNLSIRHSFSAFVRKQTMLQQRQLEKSPAKLHKLTKPVWRQSGLSEKTTYKYTCTECHELLIGKQDVCKCPELPYAEHDNIENPECKKTCIERFTGEIIKNCL